jgi:hypothetical protein
MNANYTILNREAALSILNAAEKRCSARTFGDLEAIETALKDLLAEKGYAKTCNSKLKGIRAIVGETTGENRSRGKYFNNNQTTWTTLAHNGKGWVLESACRDYTSKDSKILDVEASKAFEAERLANEAEKKAHEEVKKQVSDAVLSKLRSVTYEEAKNYAFKSYSTYNTLDIVSRIVEEFGREIGRDLRTDFDCLDQNHPSKGSDYSKLLVSFYVPNRKPHYCEYYLTAVVQLPDTLFCENCENCKTCFFCKDCKNCEDCSGCTGCTDCHHCNNCINCSDCNECSSCDFCSGLIDQFNCEGIEKTR